MTTIKYKRALEIYNGFKGCQTVKTIINQIPENFQKELTGKQLGILMNVINNAYQNGRGDERNELEENELVTYPH